MLMHPERHLAMKSHCFLSFLLNNLGNLLVVVYHVITLTSASLWRSVVSSSSFSVALTKYLPRNNFREGDLQFEGSVHHGGGVAWQQGCPPGSPRHQYISEKEMLGCRAEP